MIHRIRLDAAKLNSSLNRITVHLEFANRTFVAVLAGDHENGSSAFDIGEVHVVVWLLRDTATDDRIERLGRIQRFTDSYRIYTPRRCSMSTTDISTRSKQPCGSRFDPLSNS